MMKIRSIDNSKAFPVLVTLLYSAICLFAAYLTTHFHIAQGFLFLLLIFILYAIFQLPNWVVYCQLAFWMGTKIWVGAQYSASFQNSLINEGVAAFITVIILLVLYQVFAHQRKAFLGVDSRYQHLIANAPGFEYWQRLDGTLEYISPACEQITGYSDSEFLQYPELFSQIILPEDQDKVPDLVPSGHEPPINVKKEEVRIEHRSGQIRWVEYYSRCVYDKSGQMAGRCISMYDISSRKKETENLKIQFERLHSALETSEDGIWDMNLADGKTYFNPRYATLLGLKPGENHIILKDYLELIHPDDLDRMMEAFKSHIARKTSSYQAEYRLLTRFGKWRWVLDRGRIMTQDSSGKATRMVGTHIDITERKMIQDALQQSEEKFRQLAENMRELFWLRDKESGKFIYISPAFTEIWGHSAEEMYEDPNLFLDTIHWEDFSRVYHSLRELVTTGEMFTEEYRIIHPDGTVRWVFSRAYPIYDSSGNYYRIAGIAEDITKRMEIDSALRKSEKRYRDLIERQGDGVSIIDPEKNILYMNPAGEDIFGVEHGNMMNRNLHEFMDDEQYEIMLDQMKKDQKTGESSFEIRITRGDQNQRSILITSTPRYDTYGQFLGEIAIFKDITQRKEQENKLWYMGMHDSLTGLFNRANFDTEVERLEGSDAFPIGIIMVDVDDLKLVNDQFGHAAGDDMLLRISKLLKKSVRSGDLVARIGGDEFAILMPNSDENTLPQILSRIDMNIIAENEQKDLNYTLSVSAGGSTAKQQYTLRENIEYADVHMYEVKNNKKKRFPFNLPERELPK